jgi:hypothetical protein
MLNDRGPEAGKSAREAQALGSFRAPATNSESGGGQESERCEKEGGATGGAAKHGGSLPGGIHSRPAMGRGAAVRSTMRLGGLDPAKFSGGWNQGESAGLPACRDVVILSLEARRGSGVPCFS